MPVSLAGFVKNRRHQFGRESTFNTRVAAKRAYAFKGVPELDPKWTDPDVDVFDREAVFIDRVLTGLTRDFPDLKIVLEHITTAEAAEIIGVPKRKR